MCTGSSKDDGAQEEMAAMGEACTGDSQLGGDGRHSVTARRSWLKATPAGRCGDGLRAVGTESGWPRHMGTGDRRKRRRLQLGEEQQPWEVVESFTEKRVAGVEGEQHGFRRKKEAVLGGRVARAAFRLRACSHGSGGSSNLVGGRSLGNEQRGSGHESGGTGFRAAATGGKCTGRRWRSLRRSWGRRSWLAARGGCNRAEVGTGAEEEEDKICAGPPWTKPAGPWWTGCSKNCVISLFP